MQTLTHAQTYLVVSAGAGAVTAWIAEARRVLSLTFPPDVEAEIQREVRRRLLRGPKAMK